MQNYKKDNVIALWLGWHFIQVPRFLFSVWGNYLSFGVYYFSLLRLSATLVAPWKKNVWAYPKNFDIGEYFGIFISNIFSRFFGAIARLGLIIVGCAAQVGIFFAGVLVILFWLLMPFLVIGLFFYAI